MLKIGGKEILSYIILFLLIVGISFGVATIYKRNSSFIKNHKEAMFIFIIIITPFIFLLTLKLIYTFLPGIEIGEVGNWIEFSGTYLGAIIGITGIAYQIYRQSEDRKEDEKKAIIKERAGAKRFVIYYLKVLKENIERSKVNLILMIDINCKTQLEDIEEEWIIDNELSPKFFQEIEKFYIEDEVGIELIKIYKDSKYLESIIRNVLIEFRVNKTDEKLPELLSYKTDEKESNFLYSHRIFKIRSIILNKNHCDKNILKNYLNSIIKALNTIENDFLGLKNSFLQLEDLYIYEAKDNQKNFDKLIENIDLVINKLEKLPY